MRIFIYNRLGNKPMKSKILLIGLALAIAAAIGLYLLMNARCYQLLGNLVCHGTYERKHIALTFDDAPSEHTSDAVLAVLAEKNVKATFFMIGENIEHHPQAAHRIAAAGHEMGNHSYSHRRFLLRSPAFIAREIEDTNALIRTAGYHGPIHFRPPYGKKLIGLPWYLARHNITTVMWDSEPARHQAPPPKPSLPPHSPKRTTGPSSCCTRFAPRPAAQNAKHYRLSLTACARRVTP